MEMELQEKLLLAKTLEADNKSLQRKERLLSLQVSNGERTIMCQQVEVSEVPLVHICRV